MSSGLTLVGRLMTLCVFFWREPRGDMAGKNTRSGKVK
jgi:hypothetical protein